MLITGAGGEIGHGLIERLSGQSRRGIVTLDLARLDPTIAPLVDREITGSILDRPLLERVLAEYQVELVFHLAALLSTRSEFTPLSAHQVNVEGTLNLLEFAQHEAESHGKPVIFMYPSSIAVYGLPSLEEKQRAGRVSEDAYTHPTTMYGCNKLYCEQLGHYYSQVLQAAGRRVGERAGGFPLRAVSRADLGGHDAVGRHVGLRPGDDSRGSEGRAVRLIRAAGRAHSVHGDARRGRRAAAAGGRAARRPDAHRLQRRRVQPPAEDVRRVVLRAFPDADISWDVDAKRQGIIDTWPADVDDSAARRDWGFAPRYDFEQAFKEYLIPTIRRAVRTGVAGGLRKVDRSGGTETTHPR